MAEIVTLAQLKQAFWHSVILTGDTRRMVARAPKMDGNSEGPPVPISIFVPQSPGDDFDLVLSLCEDGTHRVTVDWDKGIGATDPYDQLKKYRDSVLGLSPSAPCYVVTPSTDHWHIWGETPVTWAYMTELLAALKNPGYAGMNIPKGFCGLRPPWKNKYNCEWGDAIRYRFDRLPDKDMFLGLDWSAVREAEEELVEAGISLEDLFSEEGD